MAGTLTVQNLQGPSSGANANKIIVPSGQTLDASSGTLVPSVGQIVKATRWTSSSFNGTSTNNAYTTLTSISLTATAGNIMAVTGAFPTRGAASSAGWNLTLIRLYSDVDGVVWNSGFEGKYADNEVATHVTINGNWYWGGSGTNTHTISLQLRAYGGTLRYFGTNNQDSATSQPTLTFWEIAQ